MSVRFVNSAALLTAANDVIGVNKDRASVAFFLRINGPLPLTSTGWSGGAYFAARSGALGFGVNVLSVSAANQTMRVRFFWQATNSSTVNYSIDLSPSLVYAVAMTYDKDDSTKQALYINGVKYQMTTPQSLPLNATSTYLQLGHLPGGTVARDYSLEKWMWWNDYVLSLDDVFDVMYGVGDPTNIGLSASWRGYWKLDGTPDGTPTTGDAALGNLIDASWPLSTSVRGDIPGSMLAYGDAMPFVSQATYEAPVVCSSGKAIRVATKDDDGDDLEVNVFGTDPTIRINGGSPITLSTHFSETHLWAIYFLPEGEKIEPGDSVTFTAADGFLVTGMGAVAGCTDLACVNKAGEPIYGDQARTMLAGLNYTYPASTYWSYYQGPANRAFRMLVDLSTSTSAGVREDGTIRNTRVGILLDTAAFSTNIDLLGTPMPLGKYVVSYVPKDAGRETNIELTSITPGCCSELTEYRNDGSVAGDRIIKVFELIEGVDYPNTLVGDVDATTTSIPLANTTNLVGRSIFTGVAPLWLKIDDEYMTIEDVNTTTKVVTVSRPALGSIAAAHSSGTDCVARYHSQNPQLRVNTNGPSGEPNYSDLVIYHESDVELPDPPAPVTDLDTSLDAQLAPTRFIRDSMVHNGIVRHMDSAMGNGNQIVEPEHLRLPTDLYWGFDSKFNQDFRYTDLKPFDPEATPYYYMHYPGTPGSETYSATLAGAIDASQTTIEISDAATAPVIAGSRLFIGSEQLRVTAVDGTSVTVVRGCMGTTAASHAAGAITVGWRVPWTSEAQYTGNSNVPIDLTTDRPHLLRTTMYAGDPAKIDMNPLARGTVTLAADVEAGATTITISADDWTYIKPGLYIKFGSDSPVRLATADSGTGVCTLDHKVGSAHASGTAGSTMACGVWCKSTDGASHAWSPKQGIAPVFYVTGANRLMVRNYVNIPGKTAVVDGAQVWDQTPDGEGASDKSMIHFKTPIQIYPEEYTAKVSALSPGCVHWLNIAAMASDETVYDIATRIRDNLPSGVGHSVVVELSNEVWNGVFMAPWLYQNFAKTTGATDSWLDPWILRTKAVTQIVRDVFAAGGHDAEVLLALMYQSGNLATPLSRARALGVDVDVVGTAPYYDPEYTETSAALFEALDDDQCIDLWLFDYECNTAGPAVGQKLRNKDLPARAEHESLTGRPLKYYTYEGGYKSMLPLPPNGTNDTSVYAHGVERNLDLSYNPTLHPAAQDRLFVEQRWGVDGFTFFDHCQAPALLDQGAGHYHEMWGLCAYHGQPAGRGDGSDGKADNRLTLATPGKPNSKGPLDNLAKNNVSVRLQAVLDWNAARVAGAGGVVPAWTRRRIGRGLHRASVWG